MTTEEKFYAAVNVIKNLPKNGSYQPSNELLLKFYAYYKQATEGPCTSPKPAFWELVKKAKWVAWSELGNMSKLEAMENYVNELKKIIETMSYTENVANFIGSLDSFYESIPIEDLELLVGPVFQHLKADKAAYQASRDSTEQSSNEVQNSNSEKYLSFVDINKKDDMDDDLSYFEAAVSHQFDESTVELTPDVIEKKYSKLLINGEENDKLYFNADMEAEISLPRKMFKRRFESNEESLNSNTESEESLNSNIESENMTFVNDSLTLACLQSDLEQILYKINDVEEQIQLYLRLGPGRCK